ncbi:MAG: hypothetical protein ACRDKI_11955 [Solirubrobacterales bacterium]
MSDEFIDEAGSAPQTEVESIWLTRTSVKPVWLAVAIACTLLGLFSFWPLMVGGAVAAVVIALAWLSESREESDELPLT